MSAHTQKSSRSWSMALESVGCAASGAAFGAALTAAGVHMPSVILDQFRLTNFRMFEVFSIALGSSIFIIYGLDKLQIAKRQVRSNTSLGLFSRYDGNILGGSLVGLGMSLSGSCPGTVTAQLAQGVPTALVTALGGLLGGMAHIWITRPSSTSEPATSTSDPELETITAATGISETVLYTISGGAWLSYLYYAFFVQHPSSVWSSAAAGGLYLGLAQLTSILATQSTLGASGIYDQAGRYVWRILGADVALPPSPPRSLLFGAGAVTGSFMLTQVLPTFSKTSAVTPHWSMAMAGGFIMAFGAKVAKGCTSGHGLSGIGGLSFPSLISVAAMFGTGIASQSSFRLLG